MSRGNDWRKQISMSTMDISGWDCFSVILTLFLFSKISKMNVRFFYKAHSIQ